MAKKEENRDKVLFIDARNYYTVVDRTLNEWSEWQMKNLNAIVWLYRGATEKYSKLLEEYGIAIKTAVAELPRAGEKLSEMLDEGSRGHFIGNMPVIDDAFDIDKLYERLEWQATVTKKAVPGFWGPL